MLKNPKWEWNTPANQLSSIAYSLVLIAKMLEKGTITIEEYLKNSKDYNDQLAELEFFIINPDLALVRVSFRKFSLPQSRKRL